MPLELCYGCGKKVSITTDQCPKCGEREPTPIYRRRPTYGKSVKYSIKDDFKVLCSNCHKMVHRRNPPFTIEEIIKIIKK
jgi:RNA polymerase subunit RPABC4/transcription elongation factor Spt4